jgi:GNAT superfamily N-acetyltransferase
MVEAIVIRPAGTGDMDEVYEICLKTGDAGLDATALYLDPDLIGHIYAGPYVLLDGSISFVAEDEDGLLGYAVGAADTRDHEGRLERDWWPVLRKRYPSPSTDRSAWSDDDKLIWSIYNPTPDPEVVTSQFPAHIHMNLLPRARGRGLGTKLLACWSAAARSRGVSAVHAGVSADNKAGLAFWTARGFIPVMQEPEGGTARTIWCGKVL